MRDIVCKIIPFPLYFGCKIIIEFFRLEIWAIFHCSIIQANTLIWYLSHWIPLFALVTLVPIILSHFIFSSTRTTSGKPYLGSIPLDFPLHLDRSNKHNF
jgi:hypothetical protein